MYECTSAAVYTAVQYTDIILHTVYRAPAVPGSVQEYEESWKRGHDHWTNEINTSSQFTIYSKAQNQRHSNPQHSQ